MKKLVSLLMTLAMVLSMSVVAFAETREVATSDALKDALANAQSGDTIKFTDKITLDKAITVPDGVEIDLNDNTLYVNVENSYYNNVTIKNGNIVIGKDDAHVCDGYFIVNAGKKLTLQNVNVSSAEGGIKGYAVFHLKTGAKLDLISSNLSIKENEYSSGYIVYAGEKTAEVNIEGTTIEGSKTNGIVNANTVMTDSNFTLTDVLEHGINRSAVSVEDSKVAISGGKGRGITPEHGNLQIIGDSEIIITDMNEAAIDVRGNNKVIIDEEASLSANGKIAVPAGTTLESVVSFKGENKVELSENGIVIKPVTVAPSPEKEPVRDTVVIEIDMTGKADAEESEGEENPNTGAPVMIPVAAVLAVLSGAVISKK